MTYSSAAEEYWLAFRTRRDPVVAPAWTKAAVCAAYDAGVLAGVLAQANKTELEPLTADDPRWGDGLVDEVP